MTNNKKLNAKDLAKVQGGKGRAPARASAGRATGSAKGSKLGSKR
jgi:bacteriocin-like protein